MTTFVCIGWKLPFLRLALHLKLRGFASITVKPPRFKSTTPNQDCANAVIEALRDVSGDIVVLGVSHQGLILPLIAAARPIRRLVYVNALIPYPGRPFMDILREQSVFAPGLLEATLASANGVTDEFLDMVLFSELPSWLVKLIKLIGKTKKNKNKDKNKNKKKIPLTGLLEPCPLSELPKVDSVSICGSEDQAVRPEWQQWAARELLGVEPVVIKGARHGSILRTNAKQIADAATRGL